MFAVFLAPKWSKGTGSPSTIAAALGWTLLLIGAVFSSLGTFELGRNLSPFPRPKNDSELIARGAYAVVRHPIYCGIIFLASGWSILHSSILAMVLSVVLFLFFDLKARREERWLAEKFPEYVRYKRRVKKLIPFVY